MRTSPLPTVAGAAESTSTVSLGSDIGVGRCIRVTRRAMRLCSNTKGNPSKGILSMCDNLKMGRVHAGAVAAEMIDFQAIRDRPDQKLVGKTMSDDPGATIEPKITVTCWFLGRQPRPAEFRPTTTIDFGPKSFSRWFAGVYSLWHRKLLSVSMQPEVYRLAAASILPPLARVA